jgi:DNA polymerase III gamma/tau subunit
MEIAAAVFTGVENMRQVQDAVKYNPISGATARAVIVDECHRLSGPAWDSLLKALEEPSKNVYWFLLTTEFQKVPETIKTRCVKVKFKSVSNDTLRDLLCDVCDSEDLETPDSVIDLVVKQAKGSPREALSCLSTVANMTNRQEAAKALEDLSESQPVLELCRFLMKPNGSWTMAMSLVAQLEKENPESVRLAIVNYIAVAVRNEKNNDTACRLLGMLDCFATPYYNAGERFAPLMRSIGQILFAPE